MRLDLATLTVCTVFVTAVLGLLLLFAWWKNRAVAALGLWGAGFVAAVAAFGLLVGRGHLPGLLSIGVGNAVLFLGYGLFWAGFRVFEGRSAPSVVIAAGALVWLAGCGVPDIYKSLEARVAVASLVAGGYAFAAAFELWRGRAERLASRMPIAICLVGHGISVLCRLPGVLAWSDGTEAAVFTAPWIVPHAFGTLLFTVTTAFLLLAMTKERIEAEQRAIASRDPLTGTLNRRAFLDEGRAGLDRARRDGRTCCLLLADLDHFKRINDRYGHAAGDRVLHGFCEIAAGLLPKGGLLARLGGEEFAVLLDASDLEAARLGDGIRRAVAAARFETDREAFATTVSIGIATTEEAGHVLDGLIAAADLALYRAKDEGRNRVARVLAEGEPAPGPAAVAA